MLYLFNRSDVSGQDPSRRRVSSAVDNPDVRTATLVFYMLTFAFGIFGNTLVIFVIAKYDRIRSRSVSNYYIWNLAFADVLFVLTVPFIGFTSFTNNWVFGEWACKVKNFTVLITISFKK